jgi:hypothetical protein
MDSESMIEQATSAEDRVVVESGIDEGVRQESIRSAESPSERLDSRSRCNEGSVVDHGQLNQT